MTWALNPKPRFRGRHAVLSDLASGVAVKAKGSGLRRLKTVGFRV